MRPMRRHPSIATVAAALVLGASALAGASTATAASATVQAAVPIEPSPDPVVRVARAATAPCTSAAPPAPQALAPMPRPRLQRPGRPLRGGALARGPAPLPSAEPGPSMRAVPLDCTMPPRPDRRAQGDPTHA